MGSLDMNTINHDNRPRRRTIAVTLLGSVA